MSDNQPSIRKLIADVKTDAQTLLKAQTELATTEIKGAQREAGATGGMFAGAAFLGLMGLIFLLVAAAYGLVAAGLPVWAGFLIVAVLILILAGILAAVGKKRAKNIKGPELAKAEWERTKKALSGAPPETDLLPAPRTTDAIQQKARDVTRSN